MDGETNDDRRRTRSGKYHVGTKNSKKRSREEDVESTGTSKRMAGEEDDNNTPISVQLAELRSFLGKKIDDGHNKLEASVSSLTTRLDKNEAEIQRHKLNTNLAIESLRASMNDIKNTSNPVNGGAVGGAASYAETAGMAAAATHCPRTGQLSVQYWAARQSARVSPIEGAGEEEIWSSLQKFFFEKMRIPQSELRQSDILHVRRVLTARGRQSRLEVSVKFVDLETKDRVGSYARNLGDYIVNGKSTATFRFDIPSHLTGVHRTLMQYGYDLGKKYGLGFKKNIRHDDAAMSYCIDVLIPGQSTNKWTTVTYEQAYADRMEARDKKQLGEGLSTRMPMLEKSSVTSRKERSASVSATNSSSPAYASTSSSSSSGPYASTSTSEPATVTTSPMDQGPFQPWGMRP